MKTYCPNTKPTYTFTRPITLKGDIADYFSLLISMYKGKTFTHTYAKSRRIFATVQNLRMAGYLNFDNNEFVISELGCDYVVEHLWFNEMSHLITK